MKKLHQPKYPANGNMINLRCHFRKIEDAHGDLFVFIDENEDTIFDGQFGNPGNPVLPDSEPNQWWDMPANRHNQGANLSFTDGHVEHWKWKAPMICTGFPQDVGPEAMPDYQRVQNAMKQLTDN